MKVAISKGLKRWFAQQLVEHPLMIQFSQRSGIDRSKLLATLVPEIRIEPTSLQEDAPRFVVVNWGLVITIGEEAKLALEGIDQIEAQRIVQQAVNDGRLPIGPIKNPDSFRSVTHQFDGVIYCMEYEEMRFLRTPFEVLLHHLQIEGIALTTDPIFSPIPTA